MFSDARINDLLRRRPQREAQRSRKVGHRDHTAGCLVDPERRNGQDSGGLALLIGGVCAALLAFLVVAPVLSGAAGWSWWDWTMLAWMGITAAFLLPGAVLLLANTLVGRLLIVVGCGMSIAIVITLGLVGPGDQNGYLIVSITAAVPLAATMALALAPSTKKRCQYFAQDMQRPTGTESSRSL